MLNSINEAQVFTKLDLWNAYHLVWIHGGQVEDSFQDSLRIFQVPSDAVWINKCSCCVPGPTMYRRISLTRNKLNSFMFIYIDNILIFIPGRTCPTCSIGAPANAWELPVHEGWKVWIHANTVSFLRFISTGSWIQKKCVRCPSNLLLPSKSNYSGSWVLPTFTSTLSKTTAK